MHTNAPTYGQGQREVWYGTIEQAEAAARDFQRRGYRRRTRGLAPGDVLVAEAAEGFSLFWIPRNEAAAPLPRGGSARKRGGRGVKVSAKPALRRPPLSRSRKRAARP